MFRGSLKYIWEAKENWYCKNVRKNFGVNFPFYQDLNGIYYENTREGGTQRTASTGPFVWLISLSMNRLLNADTIELGAARLDLIREIRHQQWPGEPGQHKEDNTCDLSIFSIFYSATPPGFTKETISRGI